MNWGSLARRLAGALAALLAVAAFAFLDWYPTVKDLGRLRRERADLERSRRQYESLAGRIEFPDAAESSVLLAAENAARGWLPAVERDDDWLALALAELGDGIGRSGPPGSVLPFFLPAAPAAPEAVGAGETALLGEWVFGRQAAAIRQAFADARRFPWRRLLFELGFPGRRQLASRPLGIALEAPLAELLNRINRVPWGSTRLEIVRLVLEPGSPRGRAWLMCRGGYRAAAPSPWRVAEPQGEEDDELLVDPDSPLLLLKVDPVWVPAAERRDWPPARPAASPW